MTISTFDESSLIGAGILLIISSVIAAAAVVAFCAQRDKDPYIAAADTDSARTVGLITSLVFMMIGLGLAIAGVVIKSM